MPTSTRVALMYNTIAGAGRAGGAAQDIAGRLEGDGFGVELVDTSNGARLDEVPEIAGRSDVLVAFGGDGTVQAASHAVEASGTPIYQFPLGTENLFAREWRMDRRYETLRSALTSGSVELADTARCNGVRFLLMCSVGPDANIVHRLAAVRSGSISHMSYAQHVVQEFLNPDFPTVTIEADGETIVEKRTGLVVIANSRQYALRLDPAKDAVMTDGLLDVVFFPITRRAGLVKWLTLARLRRQFREGCVTARAAKVRLLSQGSPLRCQLDGEAGFREAGEHEVADRELTLEVEPKTLRVLAPPAAA